MGRRNVDFAFRTHGYTGLTALEESVLTEICRVSDDDTDAAKEQKIGSHAYCSIKDIAMQIGKEKANVSRAVKSLEEQGWIKKTVLSKNTIHKRNTSHSDVMFTVNIPKMVRAYVCKETFLTYNFNYKDGGSGIRNYAAKEEVKIRNAQAETLLNSAVKTFPDDFETLWITSTEELPEIECIFDWRDLVENSSEEELMVFWMQYKEKNFNTYGKSIEEQQEPEEPVPSGSDNSETPSDRPVKAAGQSPKRFSIDVHIQEHKH